MYFFWDFDGTLYDTYPALSQAMSQAARELGVELSPDESLALMKVSAYHAACVVAERAHAPKEDVLARYACHHGWQTGCPLYTGARECLQRLHDAGCRHALYTHRGPTGKLCLERDGILPLFDDVIDRTSGFPDKPAPDAVRYLLREHELAPRQALMIGDRDIDLLAASNAGVGGVLFDPGGFYPDFPAEYRASGFAALTELLLRVAKERG